MAKPKDDKKDDDKTTPETPKSLAEQWRGAHRAAETSRAKADADEDAAGLLASNLAADLIANHNGAAIELDGAKYAPKRASTRTIKKSGETKPPKYPYTLVRMTERGVASL